MSKKSVFEKIARKINTAVKGVDLEEVGEMAVERIVRRTRTGRGLQETERGAKPKELDELSDLYVKYREGSVDIWTNERGKVVVKNRKTKIDRGLSSNTRPAKSNLTFTGQLLDSLISKVKGFKVIIELMENRNDGVKNKDIVKWQKEQGRHFFELSDKEVRGLQKEIKKDLIKRIKRIK